MGAGKERRRPGDVLVRLDRIVAARSDLVVGLLATLLPESVTKRIPLFLMWLLPILALIPLAYSLMPFWTK